MGEAVNFSLEPFDPAQKKKRLKAKPGKRAKQRSMELMRKEGYLVGNSEYWSQHAGRTIDLFGFIDFVALPLPEFSLNDFGPPRPRKIVAVQVTKGFLKEHIAKIKSLKAAQAWIECGGEIVIHHWRELGPRGQKEWNLEVVAVTNEEVPAASAPELW